MNSRLLILEKIIPEGIEELQVRYTVLQLLSEHEPIGRRSLTGLTPYSERTVRSAIDVLNKQGLIHVAQQGMRVSEVGSNVLLELYPIIRELKALPLLEEKVCGILGAKQVIVVPGDLDEDKQVKVELGKESARLIQSLLQDGDILSMTGGSTIAMMVAHTPDKVITKKNLTVIPARGSVGKKMGFQANTLAALFAEKMHAKYEVLNIPDNLSKTSIETIKQEPHIEKTLQKMAKSDMIILGLGDAEEMAKRRHESTETLEILEQKGAVAEAFRYYFDKQGHVVHSIANVGLDLELALTIPKRVVLAGGHKKAMALMATKMLLKGSYLVIDEGVAKAIIAHQSY